MNAKRLTTILTAALCLLASIAALATPPVLTPISPENYAKEVRPGEPKVIEVQYQQAEGDAPKSVKLILDTPGGEVAVPTVVPPVGDAVKGIPITFSYPPSNSGTYKFHFEAVSVTGSSVRFPASPADDYEFVSVSLVSKVIILLIGWAVSLLFLPFVVYVGARSLNKRGDPSAAARIGFLIGILAAYGLYLYLFFSVYGILGSVIGAVAALACLIVLLSRRRAA